MAYTTERYCFSRNGLPNDHKAGWQNFLIVSLSICAFLLLCEFFTPKPLKVPAELVRRQ